MINFDAFNKALTESLQKRALGIRDLIALGATQDKMVESGAITPELQRKLGRNPATGEGTLRRVTGRLSRSITGASHTGKQESIFQIEFEKGKVEITIGTKTPYAGVHEYGFKGSVNVPAHSRIMRGKAVQVQAHSRMMDIPARPYLEPGAKVVENQLRQQVVMAMSEATDAL